LKIQKTRINQEKKMIRMMTVVKAMGKEEKAVDLSMTTMAGSTSAVSA
jgi:hypothetical protein